MRMSMEIIMSHLPVLDTTVQKTHEWLRDIGEELGAQNPKTAYAALRATLHTLRDHLATDEVAQLGAQLPTLIRGIYYEGWNPSVWVRRPRDRDEFLEGIRRQTKDHPELDNPESTATAVLDVLAEHVSLGEVIQVIHGLPKGIRELFADNIL
jgi:uncharacterized protein (DUF2267 family)